MITFTFQNVIAEGSATIDQLTGQTTQTCSIITKMSGLVIEDRLLTDSITFTVDNTLGILAAWLNIRDIQAPQWVLDNYKESII